MIPSPKTANRVNAPPENRLRKLKAPALWLLLTASCTAA
jgi:hypothetical protein